MIFYPVTLSHYEEFLEVKSAWIARQSSFPLEYAVLPFISALWAIDYDSVQASGKSVGLFERIIRFLYLSLRLEYSIEKAFKSIFYDPRKPKEIQYIEVTQGGKTVQIKPHEFTAYVRPLVAEQNGLELPNESYNPELVQAEQDLVSLRSAHLKYDTDALISSVAYLSNIDESQIDEWTVLKFERRYKAIERDKNFTLYRQAELSGMVKFPKGNPAPSWCYEKEKGLSPALRTASDVSENVKVIGNIVSAMGQSQTTK